MELSKKQTNTELRKRKINLELSKKTKQTLNSTKKQTLKQKNKLN